ncbi:MAG TPA: antitoxin family protein, partial [Pirellulaceae bacterium]|nr:antitoxin family protein [Pirellulaceae bacterium]
MTYVDAIYHDGVFKPLEPVDLQDHQRVRLTYQTTDQKSVKEWLERVRKRKADIIKRVGILPDSTPDI